MFRFLVTLCIGAVATLAMAHAVASAPLTQPAVQTNEGDDSLAAVVEDQKKTPRSPGDPRVESVAAMPPGTVIPVKVPESFAIHHLSTLVVAPAGVPLDQEVNSFAQLVEKAADRNGGVENWGEGIPTGVWSLNYQDSGFTGVTGYYHPPGSVAPYTMQNSVARGITFKYRFQNRKDDQVGMTVKVNDNRSTPADSDIQFEVNRTLKSDVFSLVKLGEPQDGKQGWLAITVDGFTGTNPVKAPETGTLSADKKVTLKFTATDGKEIDTTKMRGKVILVDYWATWCGPCIESLPRVEELYHKFHAQGLEVIGISLDDEPASVEIFMKQHPHPWPQAPGAAADENELVKPFHITGIPFYLLIDKTGTATIVDVRDPAVESAISEKLGQSD